MFLSNFFEVVLDYTDYKKSSKVFLGLIHPIYVISTNKMSDSDLNVAHITPYIIFSKRHIIFMFLKCLIK